MAVIDGNVQSVADDIPVGISRAIPDCVACGGADSRVGMLTEPTLDSGMAEGRDEEIAALGDSGNWLGEVSPLVWDEAGAGWLWVDTAALEAPPGPGLAGQLAEARVGELDEDGLLGTASAWRRMASWAKAGELAAVAEFLDRRLDERGGDSQAMDAAMAEVQCALGYLTNAAMGVLASLAEGLCGPLTRTWQALRTGQIDEPKAHVINAGVCVLEPDKAREVERRVLPKASQQSTGQLRAAVSRAVLAVDPEGAERRRRESEKHRRVELRPDGEHTASLAGRDLPIADALAADQRITAIATAMKATGDHRPLQYLRGTAYLHLLLGTAPPDPSNTPAAPDPAGSPLDSPAVPGPVGSPLDSPAVAGPVGSPLDSPAAPDGVSGVLSGRRGFPEGSVEVHLTVRAGDLATYADHRRAPAQPATPRLRMQVREAQPAPAGSIAAARGMKPIRLIVPLDTLRYIADSPGEIPGFGAVPAHTARTLANRHSDRRWCYSILDDHGRAISHGHIRPHRRRPDLPPDHTKPDDSEPGEAAVDTVRLLTDITAHHGAAGDIGECVHGGGSYQVRGALRHYIQARDRTCRFPTCRQPATRCDTDHTRPHHLDGQTCPCNLSMLCRRHHQIKQTAGWTLTQPAPGLLVWTTPTGRVHYRHPDEYPG